MKNPENKTVEASTVREVLPVSDRQLEQASHPTIKRRAHAPSCDDCRALTAFHAWRSADLSPSFNTIIDFGNWGIPPDGKRAVIEFVTASVTVPHGERARLRMFTSLGSAPSNLDFVLTPQGTISGKDVLVGTHSIRAYTDGLIEFNVNRDNAQTTGYALICISGYLVDE
jgi:hypothetical protein